MSKIVRKVHSDVEHKGMDFVLSDDTSDRYGDVIEAKGWNLKNFNNNPIALFNHNPDFPIGTWKNVRVVGKQLVGTLKLAPKGVSQRIDEIIGLVEAGVLRAVSVGFLPEEYEQLGKGHGVRYTKQQLAETSLVSIPANPNALAVAKSMGVSPETLDVVLAKHGNNEPQMVRRNLSGKHADSSPSPKHGKQNMSLAARIQKSEQRIVALNDQLTKHLNDIDDENPGDSATITNELMEQIEVQQKSLEALKRAEANIVKSVSDPNNDRPVPGRDLVTVTERPDPAPRVGKLFAQATAKKDTPMDWLVRAVALDIRHFGEDRKRPMSEVLKSEVGSDAGEMHQIVKTLMGRFGVNKAVAIPADTTTSGWADTLVQTVVGDFIESLLPLSIYPQLRAKGGSFSFGRNGILTLPSRNTAATVAGAFVGQGAAIPVRQGAFTSITLTPKKLGVITTMTREIVEHSTPQIEGIVKQAMLDDTAIAIDTVLLDATASSTIRPAGLKNGVTKITASVTNSIVGFVADLKALYSALITATNGNVRAPVWIMNPGDVLAASLLQTTVGETPFREELSRGTLLGIPVVTSTTGLNDMMGIIDAADFITATGDTPQFSVSDQAVLHMEDTAPAAISTVATPNTVAAPIRSLFQTDTIAIRMIMDMNWAKRRAGIFQWTDSMSWN